MEKDVGPKRGGAPVFRGPAWNWRSPEGLDREEPGLPYARLQAVLRQEPLKEAFLPRAALLLATP